ncbi:MAG: radical SAM protein [Candidatus Omnitrophica bacterium]|nr:radical SAM protein [Candidatus Omnitrophota bacterium]
MLESYKNCGLCPRKCGVDRTLGQLGFCKAPAELKLAAYMAHKFEEPPISGTNGSGTIFFSFCTARCLYCQNYAFSRGAKGKFISIDRLCEIMLKLQDKNCHNINLVTPTHYVPSFLSAFAKAKKKGLKIPIVYNTNGYETIETLKMLDGIIDIYLPDAKYSDDKLAKEHSGFIGYGKYNMLALKEMYRQVGNLDLDSQGVAKKGLIIRHLVLPGYPENTHGVLKTIAEEISNTIYISFMNQYSPIAQVKNHPNLCRRLTNKEYGKAKSYLEEFGFKNGWVQD